MKAISKGIWIPEELWQNEELTIMEKLFIVKINSLDREEGCYASNKYFGEYFKLSKSRCSIIIKNLKNKGYIAIKYSYEKGKKLIERRVISIKENISKIVKDIEIKTNSVKKVLSNTNKNKEIECLELSESKERVNLLEGLFTVEKVREIEKLNCACREEYGERYEEEYEEIENIDYGDVVDNMEIQDNIEDKKYLDHIESQDNTEDEEDSIFKTIEEEFGERVLDLDNLEYLEEADKEDKDRYGDEDEETDNIVSHNKLKVKNTTKEKNSKKNLYEEIIGYLNIKCKKNYKHTTGKTQRCINARLKEGYTLEDFKKVIDKKYKEWSGCSMKIYLRPETLFGGKFDRYLNQETGDIQKYYNDSQWRGGQAYGKQFRNAKNSGENKGNAKKSSFSNTTPLTDEEREWAERELF